MTKVDKVTYMPTDWLLLKFVYDDKAGRTYRIEQRTLKDGSIEQRQVKEGQQHGQRTARGNPRG